MERKKETPEKIEIDTKSFFGGDEAKKDVGKDFVEECLEDWEPKKHQKAPITKSVIDKLFERMYEGRIATEALGLYLKAQTVGNPKLGKEVAGYKRKLANGQGGATVTLKDLSQQALQF